jgi:hypothetical protein
MPLRNPFERFGGWNPGGTYRAPNQSPNPNNTLFGGGKDIYKGIFGDYSDFNPATQQPEQPTSSWESYLTELQDLYSKQGPAREAYSQHLDAMPEYQTPSKWNKFGAALVGASEGWAHGGGAGFEAGQGAAMAPYRRQLGEWSAKEKALGRSADLEDDATQRRISMMKEVRAAAQDENQYRQTMRKYDLDAAAQKDLARYRDAQIKNMEGQGWVKDYDDKGNMVMYNPKTKETQVVGPSSKVKDWAYDEDAKNRGWASVETGRRNAGTAAEQLKVSQGNLAVNQGDAARRAATAAAGTPIPANQSSNARGSAMNRAAAESLVWSKFIDEKTGNINMREAAKNPAEYKKYLARVDELEQGILTRRIPGTAPIIDYDPEG